MSDHPDGKSGAAAGYAMPEGGVDLLADYLADPDFCRVRTIRFDSIRDSSRLIANWGGHSD